MSKLFTNILMVLVFAFIIYIIWKYLNRNKEGLTTNSTAAGLAGNAAAYNATIKSATIQLQDSLLTSKYQTDYESVILSLEDYFNNQMLNVALNVDTSNPDEAVNKLVALNQAKDALNNVMKFIDSS